MSIIAYWPNMNGVMEEADDARVDAVVAQAFCVEHEEMLANLDVPHAGPVAGVAGNDAAVGATRDYDYNEPDFDYMLFDMDDISNGDQSADGLIGQQDYLYAIQRP